MVIFYSLFLYGIPAHITSNRLCGPVVKQKNKLGIVNLFQVKSKVRISSQRRNEADIFRNGGHQAFGNEVEQHKLCELEIQGGVASSIEKSVEKGD